MRCEVCEAAADDQTPPGYDGVKVRCSMCGRYAVADSVLATLRALGREDRIDALNKAKRFASPGTCPIITNSSL
jgi:hypothetical protein